MKKFLLMMGLAGTLMSVMIIGGCGGGGSNDAPAVVVPPPPVQVSGAGNNDASATNVTYAVSAGDYTNPYIIQGFGAGDKLIFPAGSAPTVKNIVTTDKKVVIEMATTPGPIRIELVNLNITDTQDANLLFISDINTLFGAGTISQ